MRNEGKEKETKRSKVNKEPVELKASVEPAVQNSEFVNGDHYCED